MWTNVTLYNGLFDGVIYYSPNKSASYSTRTNYVDLKSNPICYSSYDMSQWWAHGTHTNTHACSWGSYSTTQIFLWREWSSLLESHVCTYIVLLIGFPANFYRNCSFFLNIHFLSEILPWIYLKCESAAYIFSLLYSTIYSYLTIICHYLSAHWEGVINSIFTFHSGRSWGSFSQWAIFWVGDCNFRPLFGKDIRTDEEGRSQPSITVAALESVQILKSTFGSLTPNWLSGPIEHLLIFLFWETVVHSN